MKKAVLYLLILIGVFSLSACGKPAEEAVSDEYILTHYFALTDSITAISGSTLDGNRVLLCCREEADEDNLAYYIAQLNTDGTGFDKLTLDAGGKNIPLDIASDGQGGFWYICLCPREVDGNDYLLCHYDSTLTLTAEISLNGLMEKEDAYTYAGDNLFLNSDGQGNLIVTIKHGKTVCLIFDANGSFVFSLQNRANPMGVVTLSTGQAAVCATEDGGATYVLLPIDTDRKTWGESIKLGSIVNVFDGDNNVDCYLYKASEFCACNTDAEAEESLFTWSDLGLSSGDCHVFPLPDGAFAVVSGRFSQTQLLSYEYCVVEKGKDEREEVNMLFPEESEANCIYAPLLSTVFVAQYNDRFNKSANPIGFPNSRGEVMHILTPQNKIGITTACTNKDGAWAFIKCFLQAPMQESGIFFPYLKSSFEKLANAAADGKTIWRGGIYTGRVCQEDIDLAREILGSSYYCGNSEEELVNTISELAKAYFSDDKSLESVCTDIQQRAAIYIAEHK